ncbi:MAG: hypothetical protein HY868_23015 [Chloroflexi bacterium]|nr:hypothetical protein [Chloroflexota bacterium]
MSAKPPSAPSEDKSRFKLPERPPRRLVVLWLFLALIAWLGINILTSPNRASAPNTPVATARTTAVSTLVPTRVATPILTPPRTPTR